MRGVTVPGGLLLRCGQGGGRRRNDGCWRGDGRQGEGTWADKRSQIRGPYFLGKGNSLGGAVRTESSGKPQLENLVLRSRSRSSAMRGCCHVILARTQRSIPRPGRAAAKSGQTEPGRAETRSGVGLVPGEAGQDGGREGRWAAPPRGTLSRGAAAVGGHGGPAAAPAAAGERRAAGAGVRAERAVPAAGRRCQAGRAAGRQPGGGAVSAGTGPGRALLGSGGGSSVRGGKASHKRGPGFPVPASNPTGRTVLKRLIAVASQGAGT